MISNNFCCIRSNYGWPFYITIRYHLPQVLSLIPVNECKFVCDLYIRISKQEGTLKWSPVGMSPILLRFLVGRLLPYIPSKGGHAMPILSIGGYQSYFSRNARLSIEKMHLCWHNCLFDIHAVDDYYKDINNFISHRSL